MLVFVFGNFPSLSRRLTLVVCYGLEEDIPIPQELNCVVYSYMYLLYSPA